MTVLIFILTLSILVLVHELGHFLMAKKMGVKVEEFGIGLPPKLFGIKKGETLYTINLLPIGGFVKLYGEEYSAPLAHNKNRTFINKKPWQKTLIVLGGVLGNFLLGWLIFSFLVTQGIQVPTNKVTVDKVTNNSPASIAGLQEKDVILKFVPPISLPDEASAKSGSISLIPLTSSTSLITLTQKYAGKNIKLLVQRNNQQLIINLVPRINPPKGEGPLGISINSFKSKMLMWPDQSASLT
ncbi:MAG: Membrane-associated zinc metalloprotease [Candidatus Roizmanbacteria bacterium GW2011_GWA2_33_33]|uniref:Membrane-associated zinc metalloprotease n=1 Tax=Candidatus Roizmanbacteria bacterium GW2011_GWA2_33_33 TaxID=1618476 RepID=A0A0G0A8U7_9BACT|nr:MAG: Membrane-associated zinc metalloprotease [Candidatus Roizmanbacteria bacterium GW2011_GWA2_33_33]